MIQRCLPFVALTLTVAACSSEPRASLPATPPAPAAAAKPLLAGLESSTDAAATATPAEAVLQSPYLTGATEAHRRSALAARVAGVVAKVYVREGDLVKPGAALVALDPEDFQLRMAQAEAGLKAAQAQYVATRLEWERVKKLKEDRAVPASQLDMMDAKFEGSKAQVATAEAMLTMAKKALGDSTLTAPFAGVVTKRFVNEGEYATAMPPTMLVSIEETDPMDLRLQVPANEMSRVVAGAKAKIRFPATGRELEATVTRVVSSLDARTRSFAAIIELPNADRSLWAGMFADVRIAPTAKEVAAAPVSGTASAAEGR
ncbi:MAG: efflux RND transporter periplasmic adaptor subunit [Deltaproteobacteria bacterium]|nr:efflux RND transporter periplasmic adaptor subunit [Deltaproteobacteria bacterium]